MSRSRPVTSRADTTTRRDAEEADTELHDVPFLRNVNTASRAVKFTAWRIINIGVLLALGIPKAVAAYRGNNTVVNNLDWALGVAWALIAYGLGLVEQDCPESAPWLFAYDLRTALGISVTGLCGIIWAVFCISSLSQYRSRIHC
ncbi:hypothetical protein C8R45DRAFT_196346 [Mycena sanguinolenta]|nr:hypothetical protein C8R45DRAFT_196346 [Mycena sanguinolenta]